MPAHHPAPLIAVAAVLLLAGCTASATATPAQNSSTPAASGSVSVTATPTATTAATASTSPTVAGGSGSTAPVAIVLSGTAIGGRALDRASVKEVDALVGARLGKAKVGQPQLCKARGQDSQLAVIDHAWSGLTVHFGSSGGAAVAIGWTVDATDVPDAVELAGNLPWRPPFTTLQRMGADLSTNSGTRYALLTREQVTYSGPVHATLPDAVAGGPVLTCG